MLFLYLLLAHLLSDFVFQPDSLVKWKHHSWKGIVIHGSVHFGVCALLLWPFLGNLWVIAVLIGNSAAHFAMDQYKIHREKRGHKFVELFLVDQVFHLGVLALSTLLLWTTVKVETLFSASVLVQNLAMTGYLIMAIVLTYFYEILKYQFVREKNPHARMNLDFKKMFHRLLIFSVGYGTVVVFALFEIAKTFNRL